MATPHVAGVSVLLSGFAPMLSALEIRELLISTSVPSSNPSQLQELTLSEGRVNAVEALAAAGPSRVTLAGGAFNATFGSYETLGLDVVASSQRSMESFSTVPLWFSAPGFAFTRVDIDINMHGHPDLRLGLFSTLRNSFDVFQQPCVSEGLADILYDLGAVPTVSSGSQVSCVCSGMYAVGDRVVATAAVDSIQVGMEGTVICGSTWDPPILIQWDTLTSGHSNTGSCHCPTSAPYLGSSGWYVPCDIIALSSGSSPLPTPPTPRCSEGFADIHYDLGTFVRGLPIPDSVFLISNNGTGTAYARQYFKNLESISPTFSVFFQATTSGFFDSALSPGDVLYGVLHVDSGHGHPQDMFPWGIPSCEELERASGLINCTDPSSRTNYKCIHCDCTDPLDKILCVGDSSVDDLITDLVDSAGRPHPLSTANCGICPNGQVKGDATYQNPFVSFQASCGEVHNYCLLNDCISDAYYPLVFGSPTCAGIYAGTLWWSPQCCNGTSLERDEEEDDTGLIDSVEEIVIYFSDTQGFPVRGCGDDHTFRADVVFDARVETPRLTSAYMHFRRCHRLGRRRVELPRESQTKICMHFLVEGQMGSCTISHSSMICTSLPNSPALLNRRPDLRSQ
jgi:hypothetical protein